VTEMITGIDLVKQQLRIASGEPLGLHQDEVRFEGHAIECRLNAEDHKHSFKPSPGLVTDYLPPGGPGVRIDSHLKVGYIIPPYYDSLLAKLICWGQTRKEAISRVARALDEVRIDGVSTTIPFHRQLVQHPEFSLGRVNTRFVHDVLGY
jgi:acetyl-CoA carboxylase, biotin carboxylase subunit